jgi:CheY-like chemotaxis protein
MDPDTLAHIFEPFFTTKELGKGTGLGLAMVYGVVTQSGGTVHVESEPGRGSTFRLAFPAVDDQPERRGVPGTTSTDGDTIDRTILIVEDDEAVRRVAIRILERAGMAVEAVESAEEGLERLGGQHSFDLLLTDLVLPGMSGRKLVDLLRTGGSRIPILVMSGYAADSPGEPGDLPADVSFIQKPFTPKGLAHAVREVVSRGTGPA